AALSAISAPLSVIAPAGEALPIGPLAVRVPAPLASLSALIMMPPVVAAPTVPPAQVVVILLSALRVIKPEPESIELPYVILLPPPVAVKVTVPLPFAEIGWPIPTGMEFAA